MFPRRTAGEFLRHSATVHRKLRPVGFLPSELSRNRLRIFWSWAEKEGIFSNVMEGVPAPVMRRKLPRSIRGDEVHKLLGSVEVERDYAMLATASGHRYANLGTRVHDSRVCQRGRSARVRQDGGQDVSDVSRRDGAGQHAEETYEGCGST